MSIETVIGDIEQGFSIVIFGVLSNVSSIFEQKRIKNLFIGLLITIFLIYFITIPMRIILYVLQLISSLFSNKLSLMLLNLRENMTFFSVFFDAFWYIPLFVLIISRTFGLFDTVPFNERLMQINGSFGSRLLNAEIKQNIWITIKILIKRMTQLLIVSMVVFILRLIPFVRVFVSLSILGYQLYKKIFKVNYHVNNITLTLIGVAITILFSNSIAKIVLYISNFYITSLTLSREFLSPYFIKVTYKMEKKDTYANQWILFGFGTAMTICFGIPIVGLMFYPIFQKCAADVLIAMLNAKKLSFEKDIV